MISNPIPSLAKFAGGKVIEFRNEIAIHLSNSRHARRSAVGRRCAAQRKKAQIILHRTADIGHNVYVEKRSTVRRRPLADLRVARNQTFNPARQIRPSFLFFDQ